MLQAVTDALSQHYFVLLLALFLMLAGVMVATRAHEQFSRFRSQLLAAERAVDDVPVPARAGDALDAMDDAFRRSPALRGAWSDIEAMVVRPRTSGEPVVATMRPSEFISADLLRQANINVGLYQAVPGYLVGSGLLFTFASLLVALMAASGTISATSNAATHDALQSLLSAAAFKFASSIAGLITSIGFSVWLRHRLHDLGSDLDRLGHKLDRCIPVHHPVEAIAAGNALLARQVTVLEVIDRQWREELVTKLVDGTNEALRKGLEPLVDGMNRMADRVGQLSVESMERMVGEFTRRLDSSMREHTVQLIEDLKLLNTSFTSLMNTVRDIDGSLVKSIGAGSAALDRQVGDAAAQLGNALREGGAGLIQGLKDGRDTLTATAADATRVMEEQLSGTADGLAARLKQSVAALRTDLDTIDTSFQGASTTIASQLKSVADRMASDLDRAAGSFRAADEKTAQALPVLVQSLDGLLDKIAAAARPMDGLAQDIQRSTKTLGKAVDASVRGIDAGSASVGRIADLAERIVGMQDTFATLAQAVKRMETLESTVRAVAELGERLSGLDRILVSVDATMGRLAALETTYAGLANAGTVFAGIRPPLEALALSGERIASLQPSLVALAGASQNVARAGTSFEALSSTFESARSIGQAADRLADVVERMGALEPVLRSIHDAAAQREAAEAGASSSAGWSFRHILGAGRHRVPGDGQQ